MLYNRMEILQAGTAQRRTELTAWPLPSARKFNTAFMELEVQANILVDTFKFGVKDGINRRP